MKWEKEKKKERTAGLLNTHTGLKPTNTTSVFSLRTNLSLETISTLAAPLIRLLNQRESLVIWSDSREEERITSRTEMGSGRKFLHENATCVDDFSPFKMTWWTDSSAALERKAMALGTCVQVWMFPRSAWDRMTQCVELADMRGVGGRIVKRCSDGAFNVRNTKMRVNFIKVAMACMF